MAILGQRAQLNAIQLFSLVILAFALAVPGGQTRAAENPDEGSMHVIQAFTEEASNKEKGLVADKTKHQVLFIMGVALLIGIIATAGFGIAMVLFNKQVFIPHMIGAGFSVFLAIAHAVAAIVWFFPF
ncbi:MAG TPA: hypothetical protein ENJ19_06700 [Gammaproteobacteria bacterium]|nr:hypothetical protein [Gammaproteobacteria bacterium]